MNANIKKLIFPVLFIVLLYSCKPEDPLPIDSIDGTWQVEEVSEVFGSQQYNVEISKSQDDSTKIFIDNFYNLGWGNKVYGYVEDDYYISIPSQLIDDQTVSGNGEISDSYELIDFVYAANDGSGEIDSCTATYTKK